MPVNLQSTDPGMRLEMIRMAVIKIMDMNSSLYSHLHSDTFDVPDYEKENIVYNNEVSRLFKFSGVYEIVGVKPIDLNTNSLAKTLHFL